MQMSDHEILYHYNHAADQAAQVEILAQLNAVDVPTMRNKLLDLGAKGVPQLKTNVRRNVSIDDQRAMALYNEGLCDLDMAEALGVSRNTVADWRKRKNLKCHRQKPGYVEVQPETAEDEPAEERAHMGVDGLLRVTQQMQEAFPQAVVTAGGRYVRDIRIHIRYGADGEAESAAMELILEDDGNG